MLNDKPNKQLMDQLRLIVKHADEFGEALRATNIPDPEFPNSELTDHIKSLKELPDGLARGVLETIPPIHDRLTDLKLDFLQAEDDDGPVDVNTPPKMQRGNNLDQSIDKLLGSMSTALTLARRQAGETPPDADPEVQVETAGLLNSNAVIANLAKTVNDLEQKRAEVDDILTQANIGQHDENRERLDRTLQYGQTTARVAKTELSFKTVTVSRLKTLGKALKYVPTLVKGAAKGIEFAAVVSKPIILAWGKWCVESVASIADAFTEGAQGVQDAVDAFEKRHSDQNQGPDTIPDVDEKVKKEAERVAIDRLIKGEAVPLNIAKNVRDLNFQDRGDELQEIDMNLISHFPYLRSLSLPFKRRRSKTSVRNLDAFKNFRYLVSLDLTSSNIRDVPDLGDYSNLENLELDSTDITNFRALEKFSKLKALNLINTQVTDLKPLEKLSNLESLSLGNTQVTDLKPLEKLSNLETLSLANTQVTDLKPLEKLVKLETLDLTNTRVKNWTPVAHVERVYGRPDDWKSLALP